MLRHRIVILQSLPAGVDYYYVKQSRTVDGVSCFYQTIVSIFLVKDVIYGSVLDNPTASQVYVKVIFALGRRGEHSAVDDVTLSRHVVRVKEARYSSVYKIEDDVSLVKRCCLFI